MIGGFSIILAIAVPATALSALPQILLHYCSRILII